MFGNKSKEMKKYRTNINELAINELKNEEIIGLYLIGDLSYKETKDALGLTIKEMNELIESFANLFSLHVLRDDKDVEINGRNEWK